MSSTLAGSAPRTGALMRMATDPVLRLWLGFGELPVPLNALDVGDEVYQGLGAMIDLPPLESLINGVAGRLDLTLSGVPAEVAALAALEAADVQGAEVHIGLIEFDDYWQLSGAPAWLWTGVADVVRLGLQGRADGGQIYTIGLSLGVGPSDRARPDFANWTDAQHQVAHPGDLILNHLPPPEKTKRWPGG